MRRVLTVLRAQRDPDEPANQLLGRPHMIKDFGTTGPRRLGQDLDNAPALRDFNYQCRGGLCRRHWMPGG